MTRPYTDAANIAMTTSQVQRSQKASIRVFSIASPRHRNEAGRKRHAEQFVENEMDADRREDRERDREFQSCAERGRGGEHDQSSSQDEAEPFDRHHIENEQ